MNFFESQQRVRSNTVRLVVLFGLAVVSLVIMTNLLVMLAFGYLNTEQLSGGGVSVPQMDWWTFVTIGAGVVAVIVGGSLYKIMTLSAGGKAVAESLGGQLIPQNTRDLNQRKLLNVVEEMAIASGTPAPPVYLLADEQGINAFAAGFSPRDAVIGVTRGTIEHLNRDQLQGVIAHEFSHIFNGDMRLNIRLMGVLHGILILGLIGYYILRPAAYTGHRRSSGKNAGGIFALAIGLMVVGFAGTFFGNLIKAAVSRQREYLADASAVQFTRNPGGIAGALKRIGGLEYGSKVETPAAAEVSHAFFAQGISSAMESLFATHPPLKKRILRIDPQWDGNFDIADKPDAQPEDVKSGKEEPMSREDVARKVAAVATGAAVIDVMNAIDQIGNPGQDTIDYARSLVSGLPATIKDAAHEPFSSRAVMYCLALDEGQVDRAAQLQYLEEKADPGVYQLVVSLLPELGGLDARFRLPLVDIAIPALKQLSLKQYKLFKLNLTALGDMNGRVDFLEWSLQKILFNHLDAHFFKLARARTGKASPEKLAKEIELVLSAMAYVGQPDKRGAEQAFRVAATVMGLDELRLLAETDISLPALDVALDKLAKLKPLAKPRLLKACVSSIVQDQKVAPVEMELLRAFSDVLDCPMPPVA
ncbi:MAG: M48 family metallopeptidase [Gammaproteobacteria bacterium]|nr:MAG: M48 family metallopeptidase [Gammaproteobacteria bacterium]